MQVHKHVFLPTCSGNKLCALTASETLSGSPGSASPGSLGDSPFPCHLVKVMFQYSAASRLNSMYNLCPNLNIIVEEEKEKF